MPCGLSLYFLKYENLSFRVQNTDKLFIFESLWSIWRSTPSPFSCQSLRGLQSTKSIQKFTLGHMWSHVLTSSVSKTDSYNNSIYESSWIINEILFFKAITLCRANHLILLVSQKTENQILNLQVKSNWFMINYYDWSLFKVHTHKNLKCFFL